MVVILLSFVHYADYKSDIDNKDAWVTMSTQHKRSLPAFQSEAAYCQSCDVSPIFLQSFPVDRWRKQQLSKILANLQIIRLHER